MAAVRFESKIKLKLFLIGISLLNSVCVCVCVCVFCNIYYRKVERIGTKLNIVNQRCIRNLVKHLRQSFLQKQFASVADYFRKKLHFRYVTGFSIRLWLETELGQPRSLFLNQENQKHLQRGDFWVQTLPKKLPSEI